VFSLDGLLNGENAMTSDALNLAIATFIEPMPTWAKWMHDQNWNVSDGGCWMGFRDDPSDEEESIEIHPRAFDSDAACTLMLMEKLFEDEIYDFEINRDMVCGLLTEKGAKIHSAGFFIDWRNVKPLEQAIAEAFAKSVGIWRDE